MINKETYDELSKFAFSTANKGYKPAVVESPDGDGTWDTQKKYAHIAPKYEVPEGLPSEVYAKAISEAVNMCLHLGLSPEFYPGSDSTLRVLEYPPGATTAPHSDFCLFTLSLYRDQPNAFKYLRGESEPLLTEARRLSPGIHFGDLMHEVLGVSATRHEVEATERTQYSAVFFVVPSHDAVLPSGLTVGAWMEERKSRSRKSQ